MKVPVLPRSWTTLVSTPPLLLPRGASLGHAVPSAGLRAPPHGHPAESQALLPSALSVLCKAAQPPRKSPAPAFCTVYPELSALWPWGSPGVPFSAAPSQQPFHTAVSFCISKPWGVTMASQGQREFAHEFKAPPRGTAKSVITGPLPPQSARGKMYNLAEEVTLKYLETIDQCNGDPGGRPDPLRQVGGSCQGRLPAWSQS